MLGTGFLVTNDGHIVTSRHVIGSDDASLVILFPHITNINEYQDMSDNSCKPIKVIVEEIDPIKDLAILKSDLTFNGTIPNLGNFDSDSGICQPVVDSHFKDNIYFT